MKNYKLGDFDVAVLLGVLPWLRNWMNVLSRLIDSDIPYLLISWDPIEINRVASYLKDFTYEEVGRVNVSKKSRVILFQRRQ